jgi:hypothetical protein
MQSGKAVIVSMLILGLAAGGLGVWLRYRQGRRALEYWGVESALLIRDADQVELLELVSAEDPAAASLPGPELVVGNGRWKTSTRRDVTPVPGILHVRQTLLDDNTFDWRAALPACPHTRQYALRFTQGDQRLAVVFDLECKMLRWGQSRPVSIAPVATFLTRWTREQIDAARP